MSRVRVHNFCVSLDGFGAGEGQAPVLPSGMRVTGCRSGFSAPGPSAPCTASPVAARAWTTPLPATGGGHWRGDNPVFHTPVFVLTRHRRPWLEMQGGTTFHFPGAGPAGALAAARQAAGGRDIRIGGGPSIIGQFLAAGLVAHLHIVVVPIVPGRGNGSGTGSRGSNTASAGRQ